MYEILHHTADVRLRVTASSLEELFNDAMRGLMEVMEGTGKSACPTQSEIIELDSVDLTALLVDFLNDVLVRAHVKRRSYARASFTGLGETHLAGTLESIAVEGFGEDVKAVTYHEAEVRCGGGGWTTMLVLDI